MNERIRELVEQAKITSTAIDPFNKMPYEYTHFSEEKFAMLIVHQMLDITDAHTEVFQTERDRALIKHIKQSVKQHFGVEE